MATTHYLWDRLENNIAGEFDASGNVVASYVTQPSLYGDVMSQRRANSSTRYYHKDALGTVTELTDQSANVTDTFRATAFGETVESTGSTLSPFKYVGGKGYYAGSPHDFLSVRRRQYSPNTARWLSVDPLSLMVPFEPGILSARETPEGGIDFMDPSPFSLSDAPNGYEYAGNQPLLYVDPSGLARVPDRLKVDCDFKFWYSHKSRRECELGAMQRYECCKFRLIAAITALWFKLKCHKIAPLRPAVLQMVGIYWNACKQDMTDQIAWCMIEYPFEAMHPSTLAYLGDELVNAQEVLNQLGIRR